MAFIDIGRDMLNFMPKSDDMILKLEFTRTAFVYPDTAFKVYSFFLNSGSGWTFVTTTEAYKKTKKYMESHGGRSDYHSSLKADVHYLVAVNSDKGTVKFLSGNFFKSFIGKDFQLEGKSHQEYDNYIKMRVYQWINDVQSIVFIKKKQGYLYFQVKGNSTEILLKLRENNLDDYEIEPISGNF